MALTCQTCDVQISSHTWTCSCVEALQLRAVPFTDTCFHFPCPRRWSSICPSDVEGPGSFTGVFFYNQKSFCSRFQGVALLVWLWWVVLGVGLVPLFYMWLPFCQNHLLKTPSLHHHRVLSASVLWWGLWVGGLTCGLSIVLHWPKCPLLF